MTLSSLTLLDDRSWETLHLNLSTSATLLVGANGTGKTNVLDAIHAVCTGRPLSRGTKIIESIRHGCAKGAVKISLDEQPAIDVSLTLTKRTRRLMVGQKGLKARSELLDWVRVVAFTPQDIQLVDGAPKLRRDEVDRVAIHRKRAHATHLKNFNMLLKTRNALLSNVAKGFDVQSSKKQLDAFYPQFKSLALELWRGRLETLAVLRTAFENYSETITLGDCRPLIHYRFGGVQDFSRPQKNTLQHDEPVPPETPSDFLVTPHICEFEQKDGRIEGEVEALSHKVERALQELEQNFDSLREFYQRREQVLGRTMFGPSRDAWSILLKRNSDERIDTSAINSESRPRPDDVLPRQELGPQTELSLHSLLERYDEASVVASQGQKRALVLAFRMAELDLFSSVGGPTPILLLDDVGGELDMKRLDVLTQIVAENKHQVIMTSPNADLFPAFEGVEVIDLAEQSPSNLHDD